MARPLNPIAGKGSTADLARDVREKLIRGLLNKEVAARTNLSESTVSRALAGIKLPSMNTMRALATAFSPDPRQWERRLQLAQQGLYRYNLAPIAVIGTREATRRKPKAAPVPSPETGEEIDLAVFKMALQAVRTWAGKPSLRTIARRADVQGRYLPKSSLGEMLNPDVARLPRFELVLDYLTTLGVDEASLRVWRHAHGQLENGRSLRPSA